jgi:hypothetical protein
MPRGSILLGTLIIIKWLIQPLAPAPSMGALHRLIDQVQGYGIVAADILEDLDAGSQTPTWRCLDEILERLEGDDLSGALVDALTPHRDIPCIFPEHDPERLGELLEGEFATRELARQLEHHVIENNCIRHKLALTHAGQSRILSLILSCFPGNRDRFTGLIRARVSANFGDSRSVSRSIPQTAVCGTS